MILQTWIGAEIFSKRNKMNLGTLRKMTDSNCDKIRAVKRK